MQPQGRIPRGAFPCIVPKAHSEADSAGGHVQVSGWGVFLAFPEVLDGMHALEDCPIARLAFRDGVKRKLPQAEVLVPQVLEGSQQTALSMGSWGAAAVPRLCCAVPPWDSQMCCHYGTWGQSLGCQAIGVRVQGAEPYW